MGKGESQSTSRAVDNATHPPRWRTIADVASRQHGVVSLAQLLAIGLSRRTIDRWLSLGRLHRVHRGVYAVGRSGLTRRGHYMAAVVACGSGALLSHRSAAALWGLRPHGGASIDVSSSRRRGGRLARIDLHRTRTLTIDDATAIDGIPVTSVARTLLDLAGVVGPRSLERAVERAEVLRVFDLRTINAVLGRANGRRGSGALAVSLRRRSPTPVIRSELERRFLELCARAALPSPIANGTVAVPGGELEVDFHWPFARLVVETDGFETHATHAQFERDRRRDQRLTLAGYRVIRFTWHQLENAPQRVSATIATLLDPADASSSPQSVPRYSGSR